MANRHYCWTLFNYDDFVFDWTHPNHKYTVYGEETCPETGKKHLQGYTELREPMRRGKFQKDFLKEDAHIEERHGTREQAKLYCMKEDAWVQHGTFGKGQGARTDHDGVAEDIKEIGLEAAIEKRPSHYIRFSGGMHRLDTFFARRKRRIVTVETGEWDESMFYVQDDSEHERDWFNGYMGEKVIFFSNRWRALSKFCKGTPLWVNGTWARWTKVVYPETL